MHFPVELTMQLRHFMIYATLCLLLLLGFATTTSAQTTQPAQTPTPSLVPTPTPQPTAIPQPDPEVLILRAQLEQMRDTDSRILDTVYWALSFVGGLAVLLIGYNWFTNRWQYERDKTSLRDELTTLITKEISAQRDLLEAKLDRQQEQNQELLDEHITVVKSSTRREVKRLSYHILRNEFDASLENVKQLLEKNKYKEAYDACEVILIQIRHELEDIEQYDKDRLYIGESQFSSYIGMALNGIQLALIGGYTPSVLGAGTLRQFKSIVPDQYKMEMEVVEDLLRKSISRNGDEEIVSDKKENTP
jgi:hypothetical protein